MSTLSDIDVVLLWVDDSDPAWRDEKNHYLPQESSSGTVYGKEVERFRDWDSLRYVFRGFENYMPWVRKIHFVTWGHLPAWLVTSHPKLNIVKHSDFIPKDYLPTFNSHTIELNLHRISGLSEQFIYFNDDIFAISRTEATDFFKDGLPRDIAALKPYNVKPGGIAPIVMNNLEVINKHFSPKTIKKEWLKWFSPIYGKFLLRTLLFMHSGTINGIYEPHTANALTKATYHEVWEKELAILDETCRSKFREKANVNGWLMRDWQLLRGAFLPRKASFSQYKTLPEDFEGIIELLKNPKQCKLLCINDSVRLAHFEETKELINQALEEYFPEISAFEKSDFT